MNSPQSSMHGNAPAPLASIIIVSYNTRAETLACLASLQAETKNLPHEVILIDNASPDGSVEAVQQAFPHVRVIASAVNLGFAGGNNAAAAYARADHILLLNPDTIILDRAIERLYAFAQAHPHAQIWGSRTLFGDGRLDPTGCFARMTPWSLFCRSTGLSNAFPRSPFFNGEAYAGWQRDTVRHIDIIAGCYLLITRDLWQQLGGFDPVFFMYGEEADLCLRAAALGAQPLHTPDAPIIHLGGASEKTRTGKMIKLLAAKATLVDRYFPPVWRPLGHASLAFWPWSRKIAHTLKARLKPSTSAREEAATWAEVWAARTKWKDGFQTPGNREPSSAGPPLTTATKPI